MKKLFLLSAAGLIGFSASAQQANQSMVRTGADAPAVIKAAPAGSGKMITPSRHMNTAKVTAVPFWTEDFSSGTNTSMPTGWISTAGTGLGITSWYWTKSAASGSFNIGALNSTTASNGWMIYNSDSIGDLYPSVLPLTGAMVSPLINCSTHASVMVSFQQYFRKFRDSTYLDVSNDGGTTWTTFPIKENNDMGNNTSNAKNPTLARVNITSVAANKASVRLRFRYVINVNSGVGGTFNWLVDDVAVSEIDLVDLSLSNSAAVLYNGSGGIYTNYSLFSNIPSSLVDSVVPVSYITNNGLSSISTPSITWKLFNGTSQIYTSGTTFPNIPTNGIDSVLDWTGYHITTPGNYTSAFEVNATGDGYLPNNVDTQRFNITDTVYTTFGNTLSGGYYLHRPASSGELSYQMGVRFDIPRGHKDTLTSVSVSFDDGTTTGVNTIVQIYKMTGSASALNWTPVASCRAKVLTSADISTASTIVYTTYYINPVGGISTFILDSGYYAAIVKTIGAPASSSVTVNAANTIIDRYNVCGYFGQADTGDNIAGYSFSPVGIATGLADAVPLLRVNFGKYVTPGVSVATIQGVTIGDAFPNPANNTVSVPVSVTTSADIKVSLSNVMGQVIATENLGQLSAGQKKVAQFSTSGLAAGVYLYTVEANGSRVSNRVVVAH